MSQNIRELSIYAPMSGKVIALTEVPDKTFSEKTLGDGVAIIPDEGLLFSPVNGFISAIAEAKHAIGFQTDTGLNILVHVGLEAHDVTRETTTIHVKDGQRVQAGDLVAEYNLEALKEKGFNTITPVVLISEMDDKNEIKPSAGQVTAGAGEIFKVVEIVEQEDENTEATDDNSAADEVQEESAEESPQESLIERLKRETVEFISEPGNLAKLGIMFVTIVIVLAAIFVALGLYIGGKQ
ncbi:MAG: PTS glucose transporter subunit IIA [Anaerovibrio sp.]|uniref:PTS sugar transporter subunit IIA n=1 Tax=Anaerovibrio sp. TaxID=1872532 RepID=UPI0025EE00BB|nr:glucose PTS transporter subunit IIA [Anaerovibrio sp.]MCR5175756.1 PTS glucose transporter subunit IIA [Anaerovibrio sp.]